MRIIRHKKKYAVGRSELESRTLPMPFQPLNKLYIRNIKKHKVLIKILISFL